MHNEGLPQTERIVNSPNTSRADSEFKKIVVLVLHELGSEVYCEVVVPKSWMAP